MAWSIYVVTNTVTGRRYVGRALRPAARWAAHKWAARAGRGYLLHASIRKHGIESFAHEVIESGLTNEQSAKSEREWIAKLNTIAPNGYNLTDGGDGTVGYRHTDETRAKLAALATGRPASMEARRRCGDLFRGKPKSPEQRAKMRASRALVPSSVFTFGPEQRAKMRAARLAYVATPEGLAAISNNSLMTHAKKRANGLRCGVIPLGLMVADDGKTLVDCPAERRMLARAAYLTRDSEAGHGISTRAAAFVMTAEGYRSRNGRPIGKSAVAEYSDRAVALGLHVSLVG